MRRFSPLLLALTLLLVFSACQQLTPEEQVAAARAEYTIELNSWYAEVENEAMDEAMPMDDMGGEGAEGADATAEEVADETEGEGAEDEMAEEMAADMAAEMAMSGPQPHTVVFDLLVLYDGRGEPLPGLTVKVTQAASADSGAEEIGSWLQYLEMPPMTKGVPEQASFQLEGVPFEEGNVFAVTLVKNVPAEERTGYREFQEAGG